MCDANNQFDNLKSILHSQTKKHIVFTSDDEGAIKLDKVRKISSLVLSLHFLYLDVCVCVILSTH